MAHDIRRSDEQCRYEVHVGDELAGIADYREVEGRVVFTHTEIHEGHEGEGLGTALVQGALDDVRRRGVGIVPQCKFVAAFIEDHPEYQDLVDDELRERL
jgi:uncharacterized protein